MDAEGVYFLGVDIGTYESKAVLTNLEGRIVHHEVISHQMIVPKPGLAEHDADGVWWHDFCLLVERILQATRISSDQIKAIGCSAIAPAVLPVDREGKPFGRLFCTVSIRAPWRRFESWSIDSAMQCVSKVRQRFIYAGGRTEDPLDQKA
ncbi:FGGY family carbohydrate kinase [Cohnella faecalis]|uniref:FGGY family carbohydrate kinase n=1 Tax=Cohnella faecalis TaxID=2315694 RepID=UPI0013142004|nr:FGGY family carbohydrate kinase [Cohnella faecalis]